MNFEQALEAAAHPSYEMRVRAIASLVEAIDTDPRAAEALATLVRDRGDYAVAQAAAASLLWLGTEQALTLFARAYAEADEQYGDHYNDELREAVHDQPGLIDRLGTLANTEQGAREAVDWLTASSWQPEQEPSWLDRFRGWWTEQLQERGTGPVGVTDAEYLALFDRLLSDDVGARALAEQFGTVHREDDRVGDKERDEILERVRLGSDALTSEGGAAGGSDAGAAEFREIVAEAASALRHRRDDWERQHTGATSGL